MGTGSAEPSERGRAEVTGRGAVSSAESGTQRKAVRSLATINHGTVRGYKSGCRCDPCTEANTEAKRRERERRRAREGKPAAPRSPRAPRVPTTSQPSPPDSEYGPIEKAARAALADIGGDEAIAALRREVAYRATAVMDNPRAAPYFKSAAEVLRLTIEDLLAAVPAKDGEADALAGIMATFGSSRGRRPSGGGSAAVDDSAEPESGHGS